MCITLIYHNTFLKLYLQIRVSTAANISWLSVWLDTISNLMSVCNLWLSHCLQLSCSNHFTVSYFKNGLCKANIATSKKSHMILLSLCFPPFYKLMFFIHKKYYFVSWVLTESGFAFFAMLYTVLKKK